MNFIAVNGLLKSGKAFVHANAPKILTAGTCLGAIGTAIISFRAGMKCEKALAQKREELKLTPDQKLTTKEVAQTCWKEVVPPVVSTLATCALALGADKESQKRIEALNAAYKLADESYKVYKQKVAEELGPKKRDVVEHKEAKQIMENHNVGDRPVDKIVYCQGDVLFYDPLSDRIFKSDPETVRRIANDMREEINGGEMYYPLNEFYHRVGLREIQIGDDLGWNTDREHNISLHFNADSVEDMNGNEKLVWFIKWDNPPVYNYDK